METYFELKIETTDRKPQLVSQSVLQSWFLRAQTKLELENNNVESLTGQRHDRVQTESQELQPRTAVPDLKNSMFG